MISPLLYRDLVARALAEDLGRGGDMTTDLVFGPGHRSQAVLRAREEGILAGLEPALEAFRQLSSEVEFTNVLTDGAVLTPGAVIARIEGPTRAILTGERTALNILGHLSGIASRARILAEAVKGTKAVVVDRRLRRPCQ